METEQLQKIIDEQRAYFGSQATLDVKTRKQALIRLRDAIKRHESDITAALYKDLGKSADESYMCEIGLVLSECSYMIKHIEKFAKARRVKTPIAQFASKSFELPSPYGNVLIMSPWNYPFLLAFDPLIDAIAAGNTALIKTSRYSAATADITEKIISEVFEPRYVFATCGGRDINAYLLETKFDYIFFTGGKTVGALVYKSAAEKMTPVTLELGGKSPLIVDKTADLKLAAKRIVFGKFLNVGQTCVAPDYLWCESSVKDRLLNEIISQIDIQYKDALSDDTYGKIITQKHFDRLNSLIDEQKVVYGGASDSEKRKISPTVMDNVTFDDAVMQDEIFGPILPIMTFDDIDDVIGKINELPSPLALYFFSSDKKAQRRVLGSCRFGGGCINDVVIHLATTEMGFGGFGASGLGAYHGKRGFDTFSHYKSIVDKKTFIDLPLRYRPYSDKKTSLVKKFIK